MENSWHKMQRYLILDRCVGVCMCENILFCIMFRDGISFLYKMYIQYSYIKIIIIIIPPTENKICLAMIKQKTLILRCNIKSYRLFFFFFVWFNYEFLYYMVKLCNFVFLEYSKTSNITWFFFSKQFNNFFQEFYQFNVVLKVQS